MFYCYFICCLFLFSDVLAFAYSHFSPFMQLLQQTPTLLFSIFRENGKDHQNLIFSF